MNAAEFNAAPVGIINPALAAAITDKGIPLTADWAPQGSEIGRLRSELAAAREGLETVRALCDAADYAGITSGGWFTVEAVRKATKAGESR